MKKFVIHSDGACHGNPGPGGWGVVLRDADQTRELSGSVPATTNNRMELQAAIEALRALPESCAIDFYTDSIYLKKGVTAWVATWKRNGWKTSARLPVKNADLWRALDALAARHQISWHWLKGHAGHDGNERCDALATEEIAKLKNVLGAERLKTCLAEFLTENKPAAAEFIF